LVAPGPCTQQTARCKKEQPGLVNSFSGVEPDEECEVAACVRGFSRRQRLIDGASQLVTGDLPRIRVEYAARGPHDLREDLVPGLRSVGQASAVQNLSFVCFHERSYLLAKSRLAYSGGAEHRHQVRVAFRNRPGPKRAEELQLALPADEGALSDPPLSRSNDRL
jgi:hypothetical protein